MLDIFFTPEWRSLMGIIVTAPCIYILVIFYIRLVGKRATSQMNNFDWIVTVAMGSLVGSTIILEDISFFEGSLAIGLLLLMQYVITKLMCNFSTMQKWIKSSPTLLVYEGKFLNDNMRAERILESEVHSAIREKGAYLLSEIQAVVIEADAKLSVIPKSKEGNTNFVQEYIKGMDDAKE